MKLRKHLCWMLGHRYRAIWFKPSLPQFPKDQVGIADTEAGCVFCGYTKPNSFPMQVDHIDWENTKHRTTPPKHNVIGS